MWIVVHIVTASSSYTNRHWVSFVIITKIVFISLVNYWCLFYAGSTFEAQLKKNNSQPLWRF